MTYTYTHLIGLRFGDIIDAISPERLLRLGTKEGAFFWCGRKIALDVQKKGVRHIDEEIALNWKRTVDKAYRNCLGRKQPTYSGYICEQMRSYMNDETKLPDISRDAFEQYEAAYTMKTLLYASYMEEHTRHMHERKDICDRIILDMFDADIEEPEHTIAIILEGFEPGKYWTVAEYEQARKKKKAKTCGD